MKKTMNVSDGTIKAIHELNGKFFAMNRYWDATVSVLGVTYVCQTASKLLHEYVAHWYASTADVLNEKCLENFNIVAYYPATPAGDVQYANLQDMMEQMLQRTIEFQNDVMAAKKIAQNNEDYSIVVELDSILLKVNEQVGQMLLVNDKAQLYGDNYAAFDKDFPTFFPLADITNVRGL